MKELNDNYKHAMAQKNNEVSALNANCGRLKSRVEELETYMDKLSLGTIQAISPPKEVVCLAKCSETDPIDQIRMPSEEAGFACAVSKVLTLIISRLKFVNKTYQNLFDSNPKDWSLDEEILETGESRARVWKQLEQVEWLAERSASLGEKLVEENQEKEQRIKEIRSDLRALSEEMERELVFKQEMEEENRELSRRLEGLSDSLEQQSKEVGSVER